MKTSKFVQLDSKVLMEYIYESDFLSSEDYIITQNLTDDIKSFSIQDDEGSNNRYSNQFVTIDPVTKKSVVRNSDNYNFLIDKQYDQNLPIGYDRIKLHFPIDYTFDEFVGCYLRVYVMDYRNDKLINLSSYFLDKQNQSRFNKEIELSNPPNTLNGQLWGKFIEISFPSPNIISKQRTNNIPTENSINYHLSSGDGISNTSPTMVEFGFITKKEEINDVVSYYLRDPYQTSVPQVPDFENLSLTIETSEGGDWFDIYGIYNGNSFEFNRWINIEIQNGKRYYVEYIITMFEENVKRKSMTITIDQDFNEKVEYRPIIKYSSTTASIEVVMRVIDRVDGSVITRRSSYGMLPEEISKYSRSLVRINVNNSKIPKIYNTRSGGSKSFDNNNREIYVDNIQTVKVPYPILTNVNNIVAKTESSIVSGNIWKGFGKLKIIIDPFDNVFKFTIAKDINQTEKTIDNRKKSFKSISAVNSQVSSVQYINTVEYFNLTDKGTLNLYFKNHSQEIKIDLYRNTGQIDLKNGSVVFKLDKSRVSDVREIYDSGINMFYITSTNEETEETTVIYEGTFIMSDSVEYVDSLFDSFQSENEDVQISRDNSSKETAIVTKRLR